MGFEAAFLLGYAVFLLVMLVINLLYVYQVFRYRIKGDFSYTALTFHLLLILGVVVGGFLFSGLF
jgi:hypothetical protein